VDAIARLPARDRADLFTAAASRRGLTVEIIEKDFWVCWALRGLFTLEDAPAGLLFKGGTSLSKVYNAIERFSEDVDLSFDRAGLGFGGDDDPLRAPSGKKAKQRLKDLSEACRRTIRERFLPQLRGTFAEALEAPAQDTWGLELDPDDPDRQTLLFRYPAGVGQRRPAGPAYVRPVVRLEIGARADHWPAEEATVTPYAAEVFPDQFREAHAPVKVLAAERTFWEKATVLHSWFHAPAEKGFSDRQSRHYYDVVRLYETGIGRRALGQTDLLRAVAEHKTVFFAAAWARYDEARPGSLRLVPPDARRAELEQDYRKMREMIFGEAPAFDHILEVLAEIERQVNR
jgi:hypothetical protein